MSVVGLAAIGSMKALVGPVEPAVRASAKALDRVRLHDPRLRKWARYKAGILRTLLAVPDLDLCAGLDAWAASGFDGWQMPAEIRAVLQNGGDELLDESVPVVNRAFEALIRHGLSSRQANAVLYWPV